MLWMISVSLSERAIGKQCIFGFQVFAKKKMQDIHQNFQA